MSLTVEQITQEALALPINLRSELANCLLKSLNAPQNDTIEQLWISEACRRRDEIRSGRVKTIAGNEALKRVRRMFAQ